MDTVIVVALLAVAAAFVWLALRCAPDAHEVFWTGQERPALRGTALLDRLEGWDGLGGAQGGHARPSPAAVRDHSGGAPIRAGAAIRGEPGGGRARPVAPTRRAPATK